MDIPRHKYPRDTSLLGLRKKGPASVDVSWCDNTCFERAPPRQKQLIDVACLLLLLCYLLSTKISRHKMSTKICQCMGQTSPVRRRINRIFWKQASMNCRELQEFRIHDFSLNNTWATRRVAISWFFWSTQKHRDLLLRINPNICLCLHPPSLYVKTGMYSSRGQLNFGSRRNSRT